MMMPSSMPPVAAAAAVPLDALDQVQVLRGREVADRNQTVEYQQPTREAMFLSIAKPLW
jgi:hypothetical protein